MKYGYQVLILVMTVLVFSCITGCTSTGSDSGRSLNTATPGITPGGARNVTIELTAEKMAFNQSTITVPAGADVLVNFHNREAPGSSQVTGIAHNFAVYDSPAAKTKIFSGEIITGGGDAAYRFTAPSLPGTYFFRCDIHPLRMNGTFIVT
jgi:plastocyanin